MKIQRTAPHPHPHPHPHPTHAPPKIEFFLYQLLIIRDTKKNYLYRYVFEDDKKGEILKKNVRITKIVKIQDGRQLWSKNCS